MTDVPLRSWRRHPRVLGLGGVALVGAVVAVAVWATGAGGSDSYRTAIAEPATVRQTLGVTGTVDPVHQATLAFQVSGTVATVSAAVGQHVTAGQALASLDSTTLDQDVTSAQASLTSAQAKLEEDEAGQSTSTTAATDSAASGGSSGTWLVSTTTPDPSSGAASLAQAQQAVVSAQQTLDADSQKASAAFAQAQAVCASTSGSSGSGTTPSTTPSTTPTTAPSTTPTTTPTSDTAACTDALNASLSAQQQVATDEHTLSSAETTLAQLLSQQQQSGSGQQSGTGSSGGQQGAPAPTGTSGETGRGGSAPSSGSSASNGSGSSSTFGSNGGSGGSGAGGTAGSGAATSSAEQVALDQAAIDTATANLIDAQQAQADAQLVSPITGTVAAVTLSAGQSVSSGSTSDAISVINSGSYQVVSSVTGAQSRQVKVGDSALVTVNGTTSTLRGTVARVGPAGTTGSQYTYPVIVALPAGSHGIAAGSSAVVQVVLHDVAHTLAVPSSAVNTRAAGASYVVVLQSGHETRLRVKVGIVGSLYTQITSGLQRGTTVVLANLGAAVPSSNTSSSFRGFGGAGLGGAGFGGAGLGGAGFGGAGFGGRSAA